MGKLLVWICLFGAVIAGADTLEGTAPGGRYHVLRLLPGQHVREQLLEYVRVHQLKAAAVVTCVGSLRGVELRLAGRPDVLKVEGPLEVVSLVGTLGSGGAHLHMSVADSSGMTRGGHLMGADPVYTTMEIVLVELDGLEFRREVDERTGFPELRVVPKT